jgi:hypothetical protein
MICPLCGERKARRLCPALGREICPVCCGTKRRVEIACPETCGWLRSAQAHPAAVVQRQRERDTIAAFQLVDGLRRDEYQLLLLLMDALRRHRSRAIPPIRDIDVADAASALAATEETAARGIIYEQQPTSLPAQRLRQHWHELLAELAAHAPSGSRPAAYAVLRRVEAAARQPAGGDGQSVTWLDFAERVFRGRPDTAERPALAPAGEEPRIILP